MGRMLLMGHFACAVDAEGQKVDTVPYGDVNEA